MQEGKWCAKVDLWWCWRTNSILIASDRGFKPNPGPIRPFIIHLVPSRVASSTWASRLGFSRATTMVCMTRQSWKSWKLPESSKALELQVWSHSVNCGTWMDRHDISLFWDPSAKGKMGMEFLKNTANVDLTMYIYIISTHVICMHFSIFEGSLAYLRVLYSPITVDSSPCGLEPRCSCWLAFAMLPSKFRRPSLLVGFKFFVFLLSEKLVKMGLSEHRQPLNLMVNQC